MTTPEQRATWRKEAEHRPGHLTHTRILAVLDELEADETREAQDALRKAAGLLRAQAVLRFAMHGPNDARGAAPWDAGCYIDPDDGAALDDQAAMGIDPYPPGVTFREFTDAEIAALDGDPVVCIAHGAFIPCRKDGEHRLSSNRYWIKAVGDYQGSTTPGLTWEPAWDDA